MPENYYETLGVARNASEVDIKKAYRRLAMKYHPDRTQGNKEHEETFKLVQKAYQILGNQEKRAFYDQFGRDPEQAGGAGAGAGGFSGFAGGGGGLGDIFEDIFGDVFGGRQAGGKSRAQRGADLRYNLELDLEEAAHGRQVDIQFPSVAQCEECQGSGAKKGSSPVTCKTCGGSGQVRMQQGFFSIQQTCPDCRGQGRVIADPCRQCHGRGRVKKQKKLFVKIPAGVDTNDQIRLANEGEAGLLGGPNGDLYVQIQIRKHAIFEREGNDLHCQIPIDMVLAVLGGEFEVPTLNGPVTLKIPAETQSGKVFRLRGKGIKSVRGRGIGDLLCAIIVEIPVNLRAEQKELLREFQKTLVKDNKSHNPKADNWYTRVKRFFEDMKIS